MVSLVSLLLSSNDLQPRRWIMAVTLDLSCWLLKTNLATLRCTLSSFLMSVWWWRSHTGLAYSTSGRTRVLYACSLIDIDEIFRFLRRKPRVLFALFVMESMCWLQFTLSVMVTPRYLADVTAASNYPRMVYSVTMGFRLLVTVRTVHFAGWNCMHRSHGVYP
jgi:hypothetical protein